MLITKLDHITSAAMHESVIRSNENVMVCCGRMGPMCIPVYNAMEILRNQYPHVKFYDMEFDNPESHVVRNAPECRSFMGLPFTMFYNNGKVVKATSSILSMEAIRNILEEQFPKA
jgi:thioredoxin 1